ncbi:MULTISPECIES: apurinic/apyrimidinic endonuclease family protein [Cetobacterium]|jgi:hypothetical protein|uniref:Xylose isomerase-like TIM barrel domain-containing protein n=1 Tax=Candidatus Cetobacterium colombiensis TaxID=3073100 RepID=A0ABU4WB49_9FUSO|nr:hypothetical protein [Candidatus Cetobacterium colombiensis]MDX8336380.1 hypothetical protein [Candidatus Cetobacterium colombiensis]
MISFSFIPKNNEYSNFQEEYKILEQNGISGIETIVGNHLELDEYKKYPIIGVHLLYYPTWLEFWREEYEKVKEDFCDKDGILNYYGSLEKNILIKTFKDQFEKAKLLNSKYMVFHVSHVRPKDIFKFSFNYSSFEVLEETIKIINEVFKGDGPLLLFENLPWPGLTFKDYKLTKYFFQKINYKNKGFLMDLSHMICTDKTIKNFNEADEYILEKIKELKELKNYIYALHINGPEFNEYLLKDFSEYIKKWENGNRMEKFKIEWEHMKKLDSHSIYRGDLKRIFKELPNLKHINLELSFSSRKHLNYMILEQLKYIK